MLLSPDQMANQGYEQLEEVFSRLRCSRSVTMMIMKCCHPKATGMKDPSSTYVCGNGFKQGIYMPLHQKCTDLLTVTVFVCMTLPDNINSIIMNL